MSFYNRTKNPFPFYNLEGTVWTNLKPLWHRNKCKNYKHVINPGVKDFQVPLSSSIMSMSEVSSINLRSVADNSIVSANIAKVIYMDGDRRILVMSVNITSAMNGGQYYVSVETELGKYYSETFCVKAASKEMTQIEWRSSTSKVGELIYPVDIKQSINLNAKVVPLEPEIEEETEENGYGEETATLQKLTQPYYLSCLVPNFLGESLSALKLHDQVIVNNRLVGDNQLEFDDFTKVISVKVTPESNECESFVEITFARETIIKTTCEGQIIALNNAPIADIEWNDTNTTENRTCDLSNTCTQTLLITDRTQDPDHDLETLEWERSADNGVSWDSIGLASGNTKNVTETLEGAYLYRLKAVDSYGLIGYSESLKYTLYNVSIGAYIDNVVVVTPNCGNPGGHSKNFEVRGGSNATIKVQVKVNQNYGHGFVFALFDRSRPADPEFYALYGGAAGTLYETELTLDASGYGEFLYQLCLRPCFNLPFSTASVQITLYNNDDTALSDQTLIGLAYSSCE